MKNHIFTFGLLLSAAVCSVYADDSNKLFIVPADETGKIVSDGNGGYVGQVEMTVDASNENIYMAKGVNVGYGKFAVYGVSGKTGQYSFYGTNSWAVKPLPVNYSSPMSIAPEGTVLDLPEEGAYDFEFYDRDVDGIPYHMLIPVPADDSIGAKYPQKLFLVDSSNKYVELNGDMNTGVYSGSVTLPTAFRIAYEPRYAIAAFIFGPTDARTSTVSLDDDVQQQIEYGVGTSAVFAPGAPDPQRTYRHIEINLADGYVILNNDIPTSVDGVRAAETEGVYYTISGHRIYGVPDASGIYIVKQGNSCSKVLLRR